MKTEKHKHFEMMKSFVRCALKQEKKKRYAGICNLKLNGHKFIYNNSLFEIPKEIKKTKNKNKKILFTNLKSITDL